jgi:hypothetical protein
MTANMGWAVIRPDGTVDMLTVHDHRRGAIVNWLYCHGVEIFNTMTDEVIESLWQRHKKDYEVRTIVAAILTDA